VPGRLCDHHTGRAGAAFVSRHAAAGAPAGTQRDVSLYVVVLAAAGADCRTKLSSVRKILEPNK